MTAFSRRAALLLALVAGAGCAPRATLTQTAVQDPDLAFAVMYDHTALHVADLERSVAFYERVFGVPEIPTPGDPAVIRWLSLGGDDQLHLIRYEGPVPTTSKAIHLAVAVSELDAFVEHLDALGLDYSDWPGKPATVSVRGDGIRQVYVQDPDGYWIEVNTARAATRS